MENFLNIYKLPNLMKIEIDNPNSPISIKEIETVIKSLPIRSKTRMSAFTIGIQYCIGNARHCNEARERNKRH